MTDLEDGALMLLRVCAWLALLAGVVVIAFGMADWPTLDEAQRYGAAKVAYDRETTLRIAGMVAGAFTAVTTWAALITLAGVAERTRGPSQPQR